MSRPKQNLTVKRWRRRAPLLPALILAILVTQVPFVLTIVISSLNWNPLKVGADSSNLLGLGKYNSFVGLANYVTVFSDSRLRTAVINTVTYTLAVTAISLVIGMIFALLLNRNLFGRGFLRTILIVPFLITPMATALFWKHGMLNPNYGFINGFLRLGAKVVGQDVNIAIDWLTQYSFLSVSAALIWQWTPFMFLILLGGLQSQSAELLEASIADGASSLQRFVYIVLPQLYRYIGVAVILGIVHLIQTFDAIYAMTQGGPGSRTTNLPFEIYLTTFRKFEYGEAAAAGVVVVVGTLVIANFALRLLRTMNTGLTKAT